MSIHSSPQWTIRPATRTDARPLAELFYTSYHPSHPFWSIIFPRNNDVTEFWTEAFLKVIDAPTVHVFTVVAKEPAKERIIGMGAWERCQADWSPFPWPQPPESVPKDVGGPFFGGLGQNRAKLMKGKAHWNFMHVGVEEAYWGRGIGSELLRWGCDRADEERLPIYLNSTKMGASLYRKFGFLPQLDVIMDLPVHVTCGAPMEKSYIREPRTPSAV